MVGENWKSIDGYVGLYDVSDLGRIRSVSRTSVNVLGHKKRVSGRLIKLFDNGRGYTIVTLFKDGELKTHSVHRLVAKAWIPNPNNYIEIDHLDFNKENNSYTNLQWCTRSENVQRTYDAGRNLNVKAGIHLRKPVIVLDKNDKIIKKYISMAETKKDGYIISCVSKCCLGQVKTHRKLKWKFA